MVKVSFLSLGSNPRSRSSFALASLRLLHTCSASLVARATNLCAATETRRTRRLSRVTNPPSAKQCSVSSSGTVGTYPSKRSLNASSCSFRSAMLRTFRKPTAPILPSSLVVLPIVHARRRVPRACAPPREEDSLVARTNPHESDTHVQAGWRGATHARKHVELHETWTGEEERRREIRGRRRRGTARAIVRDGPNFAVDRGALQLSVLLLVPREDQTNPNRYLQALLERLEGV